MKRATKLFSAFLAVALMSALMAGCSQQGAQESETPTPAADGKQVTVTVTHKDGTAKDIVLNTQEETLGRALVTGGVVEDNQSTYGLYILTADGETVDEANEEWWCITRGGEQVMTGADEVAIADGDAFELTFTVGYD